VQHADLGARPSQGSKTEVEFSSCLFDFERRNLATVEQFEQQSDRSIQLICTVRWILLRPQQGVRLKIDLLADDDSAYVVCTHHETSHGPPVDVSLDVSEDSAAFGRANIVGMKPEMKGSAADVDEQASTTTSTISISGFVAVQVPADHDRAVAVFGDFAQTHHRDADRSLACGRDERVDLIDHDQSSAFPLDVIVQATEILRQAADGGSIGRPKDSINVGTLSIETWADVAAGMLFDIQPQNV